MSRARRIVLIVPTTLFALVALAPVAMAADGEGLWGRTDDRVITYFSFAVIAFFAIFVTVMSLVQARLENRKEKARQELERLRRP